MTKLANKNSRLFACYSRRFASISYFISCVLIFLPFVVHGATLYLLPQAQTVYQGDSFIVEVRLDTENEEINTVEGYLNFPEDKLEIIDIGAGGSILTLWPESPSYSNQTGEISFLGGIPGGFNGEGQIAKITFLGKGVGKSIVNFKGDSQVLLNDGKGTPAELSFLEGNYEIVEKPEKLPIISSRTHPDQNKWYQGTTLHLHWDLVEGAEYSYLLSQDALAEPDEISDKPEGELIWMGDMEYPNLEDGIYYFHLRESRETDAKPNAKPTRKWGPKITFRAMIDSTPPEEFKPEVGKDPAIFEGKYFLSFATIDKISGVDHYEIIEEPQKNLLRRIFTRNRHKTEHETTQNWKIGESPYLLEDQNLQSIIKVKAVDKAGNEKIAEISPPPPKLTWKDIVIPLLILIGIGVVWWIVRYIKYQISKIKKTNQK